MGKVIGIDLGTTNSCVAVVEGKQPVVITNKEGYRIMPSVVAFLPDGRCVVGDAARRQAVTNPKNTFFSVKHQMGMGGYKKVQKNSYTPQELSAFILNRLKKDAETYLGEKVEDAVITVPACFNDIQRQATIDAGKIAGLNVLQIINEPTAVALAYGFEHHQSQKVMVYDLGGSTFDVSIVEIEEQGVEVLATAGEHFGGDDFSAYLVNYLIQQFKEDTHINIKKDAVALNRVWEAAEKIKKELSSSQKARIHIESLAKKRKQQISMDYEITRQKFNELTSELVEKTVIPIERALKDAGLRKSDIDRILLVGGSARIIAVQEKLQLLMGKEPSGILNPDECVAIGAAIQAKKLSGEISENGTANNLILMDITSQSLSVETVGGVAKTIINRNTPIPTRYSQKFTTAGNFQSVIDIKFFQGERKFVRDNILIGDFQITGIGRELAGTPQIEVVFDIDANGIVNVSAKDLPKGKARKIPMVPSKRFSKWELASAKERFNQYMKQNELCTKWKELCEEAAYMLEQADLICHMSKAPMDKKADWNLQNQITKIRNLVQKKQVTIEEIDLLDTDIKQLKEFLEELF